ncbi:MAG: hypothetical protein FJ088_09720 [Deltaproteobacteria bacterium]|nr:hypothetical protein [Deltaproteobacteria bacterium]
MSLARDIFIFVSITAFLSCGGGRGGADVQEIKEKEIIVGLDVYYGEDYSKGDEGIAAELEADSIEDEFGEGDEGVALDEEFVEASPDLTEEFSDDFDDFHIEIASDEGNEEVIDAAAGDISPEDYAAQDSYEDEWFDDEFVIPEFAEEYYLFDEISVDLMEDEGFFIEDFIEAPDTAQTEDIPIEPPPCFTDSFEWTVNPGWSASGFWHMISNAQDIADVYASPPYNYVKLDYGNELSKALDLQHAMWYGQDSSGSFLGEPQPDQAQFSGGMSVEANEGSLTSPEILLGNWDSVALNFYSWWEIESLDPAHFDLMMVEVSDDAGQTWKTLKTLNPAENPEWSGDKFAIPFTADGINMPPSWSFTSVKLSDYKNKKIRFRFTFRTGDEKYNAFRGWMIDKIFFTCY